MDDDRNAGVTEARFALTLLTCLLVAVGYVLLLRLGGSGNSTIEVHPDVVQQPMAPREDDDQPQVLPIDTPQLAERPGSSHREGVAAPSMADPARPGSTDSQRR